MVSGSTGLVLMIRGFLDFRLLRWGIVFGSLVFWFAELMGMGILRNYVIVCLIFLGFRWFIFFWFWVARLLFLAPGVFGLSGVFSYYL